MPVFQGTSQSDLIVGTGEADLIYGHGANDFLYGEGGDDFIYGGAGYDFLYGGDGADSLFGEVGNDYLNGGEGNDVLIGGAGSNIAAFDLEPWDPQIGVTVSLLLDGVAQNTQHGWDTLIDIANLSGTIYDDTLIGNDRANWLWGGAHPFGAPSHDVFEAGGGDDLVEVGPGSHFADGGAGVDTLSFWRGSALVAPPSMQGVTVSLAIQNGTQDFGYGTIYASGFENLVGTISDDILEGDGDANWLGGDVGADVLRGGAGGDTLWGDGRIWFSYASGIVRSMTFDSGGHDLLDGGDGNDLLVGEGGDDALLGGAGADTLYGGDGSDWLMGGDGDDLIVMGSYWNAGPVSGSDTINGGDGVDTINFLGLGVVDLDFDLAVEGTQRVASKEITATGIENIIGSEGRNTLYGDKFDNEILGAGGQDILDGREGNDHLAGGAGNDWINGGEGNDFILADRGHDILLGGDGADTFVFGHAQSAEIVDYKAGYDQIVIHFLQAGYAALNIYDGANGNAFVEYTNSYGEHVTIELTDISSSSLGPSDFIFT